MIAVRTCLAFRSMMQEKQEITVQMAMHNPYKVKAFRKHIDACAFRIYGHWVQRKRDDIQNRGALFENHPKQELLSGRWSPETHSRMKEHIYSFTTAR